jgi:hypothetical protein
MAVGRLALALRFAQPDGRPFQAASSQRRRHYDRSAGFAIQVDRLDQSLQVGHTRNNQSDDVGVRSSHVMAFEHLGNCGEQFEKLRFRRRRDSNADKCAHRITGRGWIDARHVAIDDSGVFETS